MAKKRRKKRPGLKLRIKGYKIVTIITFFALIIYVGGFIISGFDSSDIEVLAANYGTLDVAEEYTGVIIRDETLYTTTRSGTVTHLYTEGDKVKNGANVCQVKSSDNTDSIEERLSQITDEIINAQMERLDISAFKDDILNIDEDMTTLARDYASRFGEGDIKSVYSLRENLTSKINKRNEIWMTENSESTSDALAQRDAVINELNENMETISTRGAGVVAFSSDGFEETYSADNMLNLTKEQTEADTIMEEIYQGTTVDIGEAVFRLVESNPYYIAAYIPSSVASGWSAGETKYLNISLGGQTLTSEAKVYHTRVDDSEVFVIFELMQYMSSLMNERQVSFTVESSSYEGIKVPVEALVEKTMLIVPSSCVEQSLGEYAVVKRVDGNDELTRVTVSSIDEEYAYIPQDFDNLKVGDVILNGTEEYVISEVTTRTGVYVVNSSVAEFRPVNILARNNEFVIIEANQDYGVKIYDSIAANAKNIENEESVY